MPYPPVGGELRPYLRVVSIENILSCGTGELSLGTQEGK